jgi:hypothetical protein
MQQKIAPALRKGSQLSQLHWGECCVSIRWNVFQYQSLVESMGVVFSLQPAHSANQREEKRHSAIPLPHFVVNP